ncbi:MAG: 3-methyl-2-oxobutanoate hydroxymethyltransferase, partial [Gemmatimonadota bacterium]|nr:3-methyl-2-oxobutanoate hydroxymethyltransferase [Gemmatimonadota bacterium]
ILGLENGIQPRFVKRYAEVGRVMVEALRRFRVEVRDGAFPDLEHSYSAGERRPDRGDREDG